MYSQAQYQQAIVRSAVGIMIITQEMKKYYANPQPEIERRKSILLGSLAKGTGKPVTEITSDVDQLPTFSMNDPIIISHVERLLNSVYFHLLLI